MYSNGIRSRQRDLKFDNARSKKFSLNVYSSKFLVSTKPTLAQTLEKGDKLILNSEILRYSDQFIEDFAENGIPLIFQLVHAGSKRATHAGVLEFSGTESGVVYAPSWMMANIGADEGAPVFLRLCTLPKISFLHLVPLDLTFFAVRFYYHSDCRFASTMTSYYYVLFFRLSKILKLCWRSLCVLIRP